jgi:hypothetical protein
MNKIKEILISYYKRNEVTSLKDHADVGHDVLYKFLKKRSIVFKEEVWKDNQVRNMHAYLSHQSLIYLLRKPF